ncbi:Protein unc-45 A [Geranomyces michiganensis]|nr:Protein unc-45 A [Geranomyces michiganensis]
MESILAGLTEQLEEFETFVDSYTTQMDEILTGKSPTEDKEWARSQLSNHVIKPSASEEAAKAAEAPAKKLRPIDYSKWNEINTAEDNETPVATSLKMTQASVKEEAHSPDIKRVLELSDAHRVEGNALFKQRDFSGAIAKYTKAIDACLDAHKSPVCDSLLPDVDGYGSHLSKPTLPVDAKLYTNRALAYLRIENYDMAVRDCSAAITLDEMCVKAWWRRAEAWRGQREYFKARSDIMRVRDIVKKAMSDGKQKIPDAGISIPEIERMLAMINSHMEDAEKEKALAKELSVDKSATIMQTLIESFGKTLCQVQAADAGTSSDAEARAASAMLMRLVTADASVADAFRICRGFDTLLAPRHFTPATVLFVLPVISAALKDSPSNRREIASHIGQIVATISASQPLPSIIELGTGILFLAASEDVCVEAIAKINVAGKEFGAFLKRLLSKNDDAPFSELVAGYVIAVLTAVVRLGPSGHHTVTCKWDVPFNFLLDMITPHLASAFEIADIKSTEPLYVYAYRLLDALLAAGGNAPATVEAVSIHQKLLLDAIWTTMARLTSLRGSKTKSTSPSPHMAPLLRTTHNILIYAPLPIPTILEKHSVLRRLVNFLSLPPSHPMLALRIIGKLLALHGAEVVTTLDGWWDDVPMLQLLAEEETSGPATQVLAAWLASGDAQVVEWSRCGGFEVLRDLIGRQVAAMEAMEKNENFVGNIALCVAECARNGESKSKIFGCQLVERNLTIHLSATYAKRLHVLKITEPLVLLLRAAKSRKAQRNLAIACARISQSGT